MVAHSRGELNARTVVRRVSDVHVTPPPAWTKAEIRKVRGKHDFSQAAFAQLLNVSAATVRAWEQGHRVPDGASARLLEIAARSPDVLRALALRHAIPRGQPRGGVGPLNQPRDLEPTAAGGRATTSRRF